MHYDPVLTKLLEGALFQEIDTSDDVIFALNPLFTITYLNQGCSRFAERHGGDTIVAKFFVGCQIVDAVPSGLRPFFQENFAKVLEENRPWEHQYECSSADVYRRFVMLFYPLRNAERILAVNSIVQDAPHAGTLCDPIDDLYRNRDGLIIQCSHCRRVRRNATHQQWDMVPTWTKVTPPNTSHGICEPCYSYYYSTAVDFDRGFPEAFRTSELG